MKLQKIVKVGTQTKLKATLERGFIKPLWVDVARKDGPEYSKIAKPLFLKQVKSQERTILKMIFRRVWNEGERVPEKTGAAVAPPPPGVWGQPKETLKDPSA